jgi:tetratricopeptide (TPR) repeat protein
VRCSQYRRDSGQTEEAQKLLDEAVPYLRRAIALQSEKENSRNRAIAQFRSVLGLGLSELGRLHQQKGRTEAARRALQEAVDTLEQLVRDNPSLVDPRARLAQARAALGHVLLETSQLDEADQQFREALKVSESLARVDPNHLDGRSAAALAQRGLGMVHGQRGQPAEARQAFQEAVRLGALVAGHTPADAYGLACAQALAGRGDEALGSLRRATQLGWGNPAWIKRDPALKSLHEREDFTRFLSDLERP